MSKPFLVSIPKSGTHLMRHILGMKRENSQVVDTKFDLMTWRFRKDDVGASGHMVYWPGYMDKLGDYTAIFLIRDPRDIIVSWSHYDQAASKWFRIFEDGDEVLDMEDYQDKIMFLLRMLYDRFVLMAGWMYDSLVIRYEGLLNNPRKELAPIASALDCGLEDLVERSKFRGGRTYRKGVAGEWRKEFTEEHINYFNLRYENIMRIYGYE